MTAEVTAGTLAVQGTAGAETIALAVRGDALHVAVPGRDLRIPLAAFERIAIAPGAGEDRVEVGDLAGTPVWEVETDLGADGDADAVTLAGSQEADFAELFGSAASTAVVGLPAFARIEAADAGDALTLDGGGGDDSLSASSYPGEGLALTLAGGPGDDGLFSGRGADVIHGGGGDDFAAGGAGDDLARLGGGNDIFRWDPGEGSDAVAGQDGHDSLVFLGAGADSVSIGDLSGTPMAGSDWSLGALDGAPDSISADGTEGDDAFTITGGVQNPAGTSTSAEVRGLPASLLVTALEGADTLAGRGGEDTLDDSGLIPGGFGLSFVP